MRVLVLGAAGKAAQAVISRLGSLPGIERLYLADRDAEALCRQSADLSRLTASPRYLDADNQGSLLARMREADLVLGCLGPFHLYESGIVRAAIAAGVDYISLCDDAGSARETMSLHSEAGRAGVRVLCGCGLAPGLSDLLASRACSRLDGLDGVEFAWFLELGPHLGAATLEHLLHSFAVKAPVRRGGILRDARSGSWEEAVEFPPPVGVQSVSHISHPEPVNAGGPVARAADTWFKAGMGSRVKDLAMLSLARLGEDGMTDLRKALMRAAAAALARRGGSSLPTALRVTVEGDIEGNPVKRSLCVLGDYYRISALVMTAAVEVLMREPWEPGVVTADEVLDNPVFFARMRRDGLRILVGEQAGSVSPPDTGLL